MSTTKKSKTTLVFRLQAIQRGLVKYYPDKALVIEGKVYQSKDLVQACQTQIDAVTASAAAHDAWIRAVASERSGYESQLAPLLPGIRDQVKVTFGSASAAFTDFGFVVTRKSKPTSQTKASAVQQLKATRKARGTLGSKQRLAIRGSVATGETATNAPVAHTAPGAVTPAGATGGNSPGGSNGAAQ